MKIFGKDINQWKSWISTNLYTIEKVSLDLLLVCCHWNDYVLMEINQEGLDIIKSFEGYSSSVYLCPANRWTIGYGKYRI